MQKTSSKASLQRKLPRRVGFGATACALLIVVLGAGSSFALGDAHSRLARPIAITLESGCKPGTGWQWTYGPADTSVGEKARKLLSAEGIEADVVARPFGETDSCGSFNQYSMDFVVTLRTLSTEKAGSNWQGDPQQVRSLLGVLGRPRLGTVMVRFPDGRTVSPKETEAAKPLRSSIQMKSPEAVLNKKVYVVVYDPLLSNGKLLSQELNWNSQAALTQGTVEFFQQNSHGEVNYSIVGTTILTDGWPEKMDGFRYTEQEYLAAIHGQGPWHSPDAVSYTKIVNDSRLDICGKANRGEIDEVWIYNGPGFGFYESTLVGPGAFWLNSSPVPGPHTCNRLIPIMGPSPERGLDCATENFGHRNESTMVQVYGGWDMNRTGEDRTSWDRWALVDYQSTTYNHSGCGSVHYPPNGTSDYDYGNPATVNTNCDDFANYPNLSEPSAVWHPITCSAWSCDHLQYFGYWFGHLPYNSGCGSDNVAADWWLYFADPSAALDPAASCPLPPEVDVAGRVTAGDGSPIQGATIALVGPASPTTLTGRDGRYTFSNLPDGTYILSASKSGYTSPTPSAVVVPPNAYGVDFVLRHSQLNVVEATFSPASLYAGGLLQVDAVVQNVGDEMAETQGPKPGLIYNEGDTCWSLGYPEEPGKWRVGVNFGPSFPYGAYVYRWGTHRRIQPGETATVTGYIRLLTPQTQDYWVGIVREGMGWWDEGTGRTSVTVASCALATVPAPNLSAQPMGQTVLRLDWTGVTDADEYQIYRDSSPYFMSFGVPYQTTQGLYFEDGGALGDAEVSHFYVVKAALQNGCATVESQRVAEFEFRLVSGD